MRLILTAAMTLFSLHVYADWQDAKALYDAGKYQDAIQDLRSNPSEQAAYFHNLGTTFLKAGDLGRARAYLEKANYIKPHTPNIQRNLEITRTSLSRLIGANQLDPASSGIESLADRMSMDEVRGTLGLLALIVAFLWLRAYSKTRSIRRAILQPAGFCGLAGLALCLILYGTERIAASHPPAFCLERQTVRSGPGDRFIQLALVEAGTKLRLTGSTEAANSEAECHTCGSENS